MINFRHLQRKILYQFTYRVLFPILRFWMRLAISLTFKLVFLILYSLILRSYQYATTFPSLNWLCLICLKTMVTFRYRLWYVFVWRNNWVIIIETQIRGNTFLITLVIQFLNLIPILLIDILLTKFLRFSKNFTPLY